MVRLILSRVRLTPGDIAYLKTHDVLYVTLTSAFPLPEELVRQELQRGVLCAPQVRGLSFQRELYIIYHRDKYLSPTAQAFIAMCREAGKDEARFGASV